MITTSQAWKDNQKKQIRAEGNIRLTFYKATNSGYAVDKVLTKNEIKSFNFSTQGTIANETLPYAVITFSIFKTLGELDTSGYVKFEIGYFLNNAWEWITYGYFMVKDVDTPENGLVANYRLLSCFNIGNISKPYRSIELTYLDGSYKSSSSTVGFTYTKLATVINAVFSPAKANNYVGGGLKGVSYIELARQLAIATGRTAQMSLGRFYLKDLSTLVDCVGKIIKKNCFNKPEKSARDYGTALKIYCYEKGEDMAVEDTFDVISLTNDRGVNSRYRVETGKYGKYQLYDGATISSVLDSYVTLTNLQLYNVKLFHFKTPASFDISSFSVEEQISTGDEPLEIKSPLVLKKTNYDAVNDESCRIYLQYALSHNVFYEVKCRIDPSFELFDFIALETPNNSGIIGFIENIDYSYNGSFNGKIKVRKISTKTPTPVISMTNGKIALSNVNIADSVDVYVNGSLVLSNEPITSFPIPISRFYGEGFDFNQFSIKVKAKSFLEDSDFSNELTQNAYIHIKALENTNIYIQKTNDSDAIDLHYRLNGGTWQNYTVSSAEPFQTISINNGDILEFYGNNANGFNSKFYSSGKTYVGGNIMSLLSSNFSITAIPSTSCFVSSFINSNAVGFSKYIFSNITSLNGGALKTSLNGSGLTSNQELVFHVSSIGANNLHHIISETSILITTYVREATTISGSEALSVNFGSLNDRPNEIYFGKNLATLSSDYLGTQQDVYTLHFPHTNSDSVLFDANNIVYQATKQKDEHIVNIYTDNTTIKDACVAKRNQYTTVHVYHNNGTAWDV